MDSHAVSKDSIERRPAPRRKRVSAPKNKTGCKTCKIRHIKCDETKPECNKCRSTGRKCEGMSDAQPAASTSRVLPLSIKSYAIPFSIPGSQNERRLFHYFCVQAASDLSGYSGSRFWSDLVLPCSSTEPAVRHALMALGSMHYEYVIKGSFTDAEDAINPDALAQYNKALRQLRKSLNTKERTPTKVVLICCILFYCFESACGRYETALTHIKSGLVILQQRTWQGSMNSTSLSSAMDEDMKLLLDIFARTDLQGSVYENGQPPCLVLTTVEERLGLSSFIPEIIFGIEVARKSLDQLQNWVFHFLAENQQYRFCLPEQVPYETTQERHVLESALIRWEIAFEGLMAELLSNPAVPRHDKDAALILAVHHLTVTVLINGATCRDGIIFANFDRELTEIVAISERILSPEDSTEPRRSFSFESALVPSLWLVAMKCYSPKLRDKALFLLSSSPRREGLWDSTMVLGIVEQLVALEEARMSGAGDAFMELTLEASQSVEIFSTLSSGGMHNYARVLGVDTKGTNTLRSRPSEHLHGHHAKALNQDINICSIQQ